MNVLPRIFRRFIPQLLHMLVLPIFFFAFMLIYHPFDAESYLGSSWYGVHITIISCIILVSVGIMRLLYYYLPLKLNYTLYVFWCILEIIFMAFFVALYIWLVLGKPMAYFEALATSLQYLGLTLVIPYSVLALSMRITDYNQKELEPENASQRMRFYDHRHNLKIVLAPSSILYITAEENYVSIFYSENGKVRNYVLRSSMKAIDELCLDHGLLRCHRSYYINPTHVKVLRKDREGVVYAELDEKDVMHIPVTKKYYDRLSDLLM